MFGANYPRKGKERSRVVIGRAVGPLISVTDRTTKKRRMEKTETEKDIHYDFFSNSALRSCSLVYFSVDQQCFKAVFDILSS